MPFVIPFEDDVTVVPRKSPKSILLPVEVNPVPVSVTDDPTAPEVGEIDEIATEELPTGVGVVPPDCETVMVAVPSIGAVQFEKFTGQYGVGPYNVALNVPAD